MEADCAEKMQLLLFFREISEKRMFAIIIGCADQYGRDIIGLFVQPGEL